LRRRDIWAASAWLAACARYRKHNLRGYSPGLIRINRCMPSPAREHRPEDSWAELWHGRRPGSRGESLLAGLA